ncbi:MAG: PhnD/SsuA/transferrin family substrate-binding protein [Gammaproteobacteria bacterium]|nr:PhnD/SsuA/transferrin family substrate-binding protein [Gammaproteobacteria bacterium]
MKKTTRTGILILITGLLYSSTLFATEYKVAVRAHHGIKAAFELWQSTTELLTREFPEHTFTLVPILSLNELTQRTAKNEFDFILTNPSSFVEIQHRYGAKPLVTLNNKRANTAQDGFGSVIFVHANNTDILSIKKLKNKTLMAVSEPAFGGWRVAWLEMMEQGFDPYKELKSLLFAKSKTQPEVVFAVRDGIVDAGVVRTDLLERMQVSGKIDMRYFRILNNKNIKNFPFFLSTKIYPEWAFSAMPSLADDFTQQVQQTLLAIPKDSPAAQNGKYVGWVQPLDYSSVELLMKRLKVGHHRSK